MGATASQITSLTIVYSTVYSGADQSKHQSSASLAFVWGQMASNAENASIWWRHHDYVMFMADYLRKHSEKIGDQWPVSKQVISFVSCFSPVSS